MWSWNVVNLNIEGPHSYCSLWPWITYLTSTNLNRYNHSAYFPRLKYKWETYFKRLHNACCIVSIPKIFISWPLVLQSMYHCLIQFGAWLGVSFVHFSVLLMLGPLQSQVLWHTLSLSSLELCSDPCVCPKIRMWKIQWLKSPKPWAVVH